MPPLRPTEPLGPLHVELEGRPVSIHTNRGHKLSPRALLHGPPSHPRLWYGPGVPEGYGEGEDEVMEPTLDRVTRVAARGVERPGDEAYLLPPRFLAPTTTAERRKRRTFATAMEHPGLRRAPLHLNRLEHSTSRVIASVLREVALLEDLAEALFNSLSPSDPTGPVVPPPSLPQELTVGDSAGASETISVAATADATADKEARRLALSLSRKLQERMSLLERSAEFLEGVRTNMDDTTRSRHRLILRLASLTYHETMHPPTTKVGRSSMKHRS